MTANKSGNTLNLFDELMRLRDNERERLKTAVKVIKGDELPLEKNANGYYRWYLHPLLKDRALNTLIMWMQEIPPGGCTGKQRHQGGRLHLVVDGQGYTVVDGVKHDWERWDYIHLPIKPEGVVFQHFNSDLKRPAKLIVTEPNLISVVGVDLGISFEQLEPAPD